MDDFIRCYPFSSVLCAGYKQCCNKMSLVPVLSNSFKCQTCFLRRDTPTGVAPIFLANECADEHFANNHIIICLVWQSRNFQGTWSKDKALVYISECLVKATYNLSKPYVCTSCLQTLWLKMISQYDVTPILSKYKKMYFMSYRFVFMFSTTITKHHLFSQVDV